MAKQPKELPKDSKFGHYMTGTGGGEPIEKGKKRTTERRDPDQPRTDDGKFTYNAVNGKPLKAISKLHGHSRGTTVPPTLTGGKNGVQYYEDKKHEKRVDGAESLVGTKGGTFQRRGDVYAYEGKVYVVERDVIERAQEYVLSEKEKEWLDKHEKDFKEWAHRKMRESYKDFGTGGMAKDEFRTKKGRHSKEEQAALNKSAQTGKKEYVKDATTGKVKNVEDIKAAKKKAAEEKMREVMKKAKQTSPSQVSPDAPTQGEQPSQQASASAGAPARNGGTKRTTEQLDAFKKRLISEGEIGPDDDVSYEDLDDYWDEYFE